MTGKACSVLLLATALAVLCGHVAMVAGTFTLNDFDTRSEGGLAAKFIMTNNRLIEFNFALLSPPIGVRLITIVDICMYDAASYFHPKFLPLIAKDLAPKSTVRDAVGGERAMAYAAYRCLRELWDSPRYNTSELAYLDELMNNHSFPLNDVSQDHSPAGIGNRAARLVLDWFYADGGNQRGTDPGSNGELFGDRSAFFPVNSAGDLPNVVDCSRVRSLAHWVPLRVPTGAAARWTPGEDVTTPRPADQSAVQTFAGIQASSWRPLVMNASSTFRPPPPPFLGTNLADQFRAEYEEVRQIFATLNDTTKIIAEYWNERKELSMGGPFGRMQEWSCILAFQQNLDVFESLKLNLLQAVGMYEASIVAWEAKRYYDMARPISYIQCVYQNETINSWRGPYLGVGPIPGSRWFSYTAPGASTPPFPGYISGHATFAATTAEIFRLWNNGNDTLDWQYIYRAGTSLMEPRLLQGDPGFIAGVTDVPNQGANTPGYVPAQDVVLHWPTFSAAAEQCGRARVFAGVHIQSDSVGGRWAGRQIARTVFESLGCAFRGQACCAPKLV